MVTYGSILNSINPGNSGGGSTSDATAANQALAIASLQSLDLDNATEAQQIAIANAIGSLETAWLAENATEARQQEIIAINELIRALLVEIELNQDTHTANIQAIFDALGYTGVGASTLNVRLQEIQLRLGNDPVVAGFPDIRTLLQQIKDEIVAGQTVTPTPLIWTAPVNGNLSTSAIDILPADANRKSIRICNLATTSKRIYINLDATAGYTSALFVIQQDQTLLIDQEEAQARISAIASAGSIDYTIREAS